jgi:GTP-binding protein
MSRITENKIIRNIAIIAHVDHGKTTLVDAMFKQSGLLRAGQVVDERIMDTMDLERERGITIAAKNCSVSWRGVKINIIDTPGHSDFGAEVERALSMADGAILLVDASEGPLPQTRFVLKKTLEAGLKVIVVINKIDRKDAQTAKVLNAIYDLFIDLGAGDDQIDFPVLYAVGREGIAKRRLEEETDNIHQLLDAILDEIPSPVYDPAEPFQMLVSDLGYSDYLGRLAVGRIINGTVSSNRLLVCINRDGEHVPLKVTKLHTYEGMTYRSSEYASAGDIAVLAGIDDVEIGDTICDREHPKALKRIAIDEPTISMRFTINNSPFSGQEGRFVQAPKIRERLVKETLMNVAIRMEEDRERDSFVVKGRGVFQMAILIETMRREGFEFCVGRPHVIYRYENGKKLEPIEHLFVDCEERYLGAVTEKLAMRKARMTSLVHDDSGRARVEFSAPSRALIGYRDEFLNDTKGTGVMNSYFAGYEEYRGDFNARSTGSIVADRPGRSVAYALYNLEARGKLFVKPGDPGYEGMIIGEHNRNSDINVNQAKEKKLSNMRAAGKDATVVLTPVKPITIEKALNFIRDDEMVEITPKSIRLKKTILSARTRNNLKPDSFAGNGGAPL